MESDHIKCPQCGTEIEVGEVLARQVTVDVEARLRQEAETRLKQAVASAQAKEHDAVRLQLQDLQSQLSEKDKAVQAAEAKELELRARQRELAGREKQLDEDVEKRLAAREQELTKQIQEQTARASARQLEALQLALQGKDTAMDEARARELVLLQEKAALEEARKDMELVYQRKSIEERQQLEKQLIEKYSSENDLKLKERDKQIEDLRRSLAEAKRVSEQGSMETQGEVLELDLEANLNMHFPHDEIAPVPKGIRGADVIQTVNNQGVNCGSIIWETKNTKAWSSAWIDKLKDDQRAVGANLAVLVSTELPEGINTFGQLDGVWVSSVAAYIPLAMALRQQLAQVTFARSASEGKSEKMEMVYEYLAGDAFRHKVEAIVETFVGMQEQLNKEKRAYARLWKEREKQIDRIIENTAGMYGDVRGLIGAAVPEIKALSLEADELLLDVDDQE
ncbi:MAG: DUF2130 domain-containing protein [Gammaproteobacteria bacterium]